MNKIVKYVCMIAVVALAFTSCKKNDTKSTVMAVSEQLESYDDDFENEKAYLDTKNRIYFEKGDKFIVFNIKNDKPSESVWTVADAKTSGTNVNIDIWAGTTAPTGFGSLKDAYYCYYPYWDENDNAVVAPDLGTDNGATFTLRETQTFRKSGTNTLIPKGALYMAAKCDNADWDNSSYNFRNICGVLSLKFYSTSASHQYVKSIKVTDNSVNLVGKLRLKVDKVDPDEMIRLLDAFIASPGDANVMNQISNYKDIVGYMPDFTGFTDPKSVTLICGDENSPLQIGDTKTKATRFLIVMRPLALYNGGKITVTFADNSTKEITIPSNSTIIPNGIRNYSAYDLK